MPSGSALPRSRTARHRPTDVKATQTRCLSVCPGMSARRHTGQMLWLLLVGWLAIAIVVSTVCGRVLSVSERHHSGVNGAPVAPVAVLRIPLSKTLPRICWLPSESAATGALVPHTHYVQPEPSTTCQQSNHVIPTPSGQCRQRSKTRPIRRPVFQSSQQGVICEG